MNEQGSQSIECTQQSETILYHGCVQNTNITNNKPQFQRPQTNFRTPLMTLFFQQNKIKVHLSSHPIRNTKQAKPYFAGTRTREMTKTPPTTTQPISQLIITTPCSAQLSSAQLSSSPILQSNPIRSAETQSFIFSNKRRGSHTPYL